jgi:hypothetical protein
MSLALIALFAAQGSAWDYSSPLVIDHNCSDLPVVPAAWVDSVQANIRLHYAHTSHGGQLTTGLERIEAADATYSMARGYRTLPTELGALCIFDGQEHDTYITPDEYWQTKAGMDYTRSVLDNNPSINVSMWSWCTQLTYYSEVQTQAYLDSIMVLESEYPGVVFIYMTNNAQATGSSGYNRHLRNEQIRQHCLANSKVLFDFADLDSWWYDPVGEMWEHATYEYGGDTVNVEHPQFNGDQAGHTTYESCEQKGRAVWWMLARLAGWSGATSSVRTDDLERPAVASLTASPNPFASSLTITCALDEKCLAEVAVYDVRGARVSTLARREMAEGTHTLSWDGTDARGTRLPSGIYFVNLSLPGQETQARKIVLAK